MVVAFLATSLAKRGGRPPSPRGAIAMMAALLAMQVGWTVSKSRKDWLDEGARRRETATAETAAAEAAGSAEGLVERDGFSLALGVRRPEGADDETRRRREVTARVSGVGFEAWWLGEADKPPPGDHPKR